MDKVCLFCGKVFEVKPKDFNRRKFCSNACVGRYNSKERRRRITKVCSVCGKSYEVIPSRADKSVTCSRECQGKWQSATLVGSSANHFKGGSEELICHECGKKYSVSYSVAHSRDSKFCSVECKQHYWSTHVQTSASFRDKQSAANAKQWRNPVFRSKVRKTAIRTLENYKNRKETSIERKIREYLDLHKINNIPQCSINDKFCVDFYLPDTNTIIEAFGDYWHSNPLYYAEGQKKLNAMQISNHKRDKSRLAYFNKCGYKVWVLWETDINSKLDRILNNILEPPRD